MGCLFSSGGSEKDVCVRCLYLASTRLCLCASVDRCFLEFIVETEGNSDM